MNVSIFLVLRSLHKRHSLISHSHRWTENQDSDECYKQETSLVAQTVKRLSTMWETRVQSLGWEDPLEKEMAIHSSTIAWKIPWTEEPGRLQPTGSQRVGHDWATLPYLTFCIAGRFFTIWATREALYFILYCILSCLIFQVWLWGGINTPVV